MATAPIPSQSRNFSATSHKTAVAQFEGVSKNQPRTVRSQLVTSMLVAATVVWLFVARRLDLLLVVLPISLIVSYIAERLGRVSRNRI